MQKPQSQYERVILASMALAALGMVAWIVCLATGLKGTLVAKAVANHGLAEPPPIASVEEAIKHCKRALKPWMAPVRNNKAVPLNKSVLLVLRANGDIIDPYICYQERPPMSNEYLRVNNLEWWHPNVGELDPDDDGFNNVEEFSKGTKPKDGRSHPPLTDKLFMVERIVMQHEVNRAEYRAKFEFRLKMIQPIPPVPKGGSFRLPGDEGTTYRVVDIQEDKAVIAPMDATGNTGPEIIIKKG